MADRAVLLLYFGFTGENIFCCLEDTLVTFGAKIQIFCILGTLSTYILENSHFLVYQIYFCFSNLVTLISLPPYVGRNLDLILLEYVISCLSAVSSEIQLSCLSCSDSVVERGHQLKIAECPCSSLLRARSASLS